ncbi:hypothetical protein [Dyella sp. Tek66A03]|uniref:hypothetical protein n=1 Tax=Dyella sp. Tek66A03 TaxID=3458298 RepID=UPI00403EA8FC
MRIPFVLVLASLPALAAASPQNASFPTLPQPPSASQMAEAAFSQADTDHDGKLTLEEARAGMLPIVPAFAQIDVNHKGYVTLDQVKAFLKNQSGG